MDHVEVDHLDARVFERAGEGLPDLGRDRGTGIVGQAVILPRTEGELGLEEELLPSPEAALDRRDGPADRGLVLMAAIVCGVDAAGAL